jgi:hypothetical protein
MFTLIFSSSGPGFSLIAPKQIVGSAHLNERLILHQFHHVLSCLRTSKHIRVANPERRINQRSNDRQRPRYLAEVGLIFERHSYASAHKWFGPMGRRNLPDGSKMPALPIRY